ncbi:MAG: fibronectin type III domain-containing protein [Epsilonproteobacteria bacterium]|nr:fibronectin type III domain-containing protein [Campylobacterota bacterium]
MKQSNIKLSTSLATLVLLAFTVTGCGNDSNDDTNTTSSNGITCTPTGGEMTVIESAKLYIEHNAGDEDTGVHGAFDDSGWSELCVYDPNGLQVLAVKPQSQLKDLTMAGFFFESREPENAEYPIANLKSDFPEGEYQVKGVTYEGKGLVGVAKFTHNIPEKPEITSPVIVEDEEDASDGVLVATTGLEVSWNAVTQTIDGKAVTITGYEVIITKETEDDPNGFSRPTYDVHVPATVNRLSVPDEFLESGTTYEIEILALEESGNQTINVGFFATE